jgi:selenocysteine lyase/cysteine desulfurase
LLFASCLRLVSRCLARQRLAQEAGTPNILGVLRCGLAFVLRSAVGAATIQQLCGTASAALVAALRGHPGIVLLGAAAPAYDRPDRLPIVSLLVRAPKDVGLHCSSGLAHGTLLHHGFVCKLLNDVYGIQARSGCSCAGPYGHALLAVPEAVSQAQAEVARVGEASVKAGWCRVSLSLSTAPEDVEFLVAALWQVGACLGRGCRGSTLPSLAWAR